MEGVFSFGIDLSSDRLEMEYGANLLHGEKIIDYEGGSYCEPRK